MRPLVLAVQNAAEEIQDGGLECAEKLAYAGADVAYVIEELNQLPPSVLESARRRLDVIQSVLGGAPIADDAPREALTLRRAAAALAEVRKTADAARALCGQEVGRQRVASAAGNEARAAWAAAGGTGPPPPWEALGPQWLIVRAIAHRASAEAAEAEASAAEAGARAALEEAAQKQVAMLGRVH